MAGMFATGGTGAGATGASASFAMPADVAWPGTDMSNVNAGSGGIMAGSKFAGADLSGSKMDTRGTPGSGVGRYAQQNPSVLPRVSSKPGPDAGGAVSLPDKNPAFHSDPTDVTTSRFLRSPADWTESDWAEWERANY